MTQSFAKTTLFIRMIALVLLASITACASTAETPITVVNNQALKDALGSQDEEAQARYSARNPEQTLEFFGIEPGMSVVEILPGGGWYTKILLPYLGENGALIGADYAQKLWPNFDFMTPERIKEKETWVTTWSEEARSWGNETSASVDAFQLEELPESMHGKADAVLYFRALHNLVRFESKGGFLTNALQDTYAVLKPGGTVGIVQHQAREDRPDEWADGNNGYIKKSFVIAKMQEAGFEFVSESSVNENDKDQANVGDGVWRLPPVYSGSRDDPEKKAAMTAIGESNRMTLKFRKPI